MQELKNLSQRPISLGQVGLWLLVSFVLGAGGGIGAMRLVQSHTACTESADICQQFGVFWQAWNLARTRFVNADAADPARMTSGAVNGMLNTLGDMGHTRFLSADEAKEWRTSLSGEFEGIGAYLDVRNGEAIIVAPLEGSPAERAGLQDDDRIMKVDGVSTTGWDATRLVMAIRGPRDTTVTLTILRAGTAEPFDVRITRETLKAESVRWGMLADKIALIEISSFATESGKEFARALQAAVDGGARAVVLDLRNNPGGLVYQAVDTAAQFLPQGSAVLLEQDRNGNRKSITTDHTGIAQTLPLVLLVNHNTASSAEILAGALQDAERAKVVGTATVGTGTVLDTYTLEGGAELLLGTTQWLTPKGRLIHNAGITPDIQAELPETTRSLSPRDAAKLSAEELQASSDTQLVTAVSLVKN